MKNINYSLASLKNIHDKAKLIFKPEFFRLQNKNDLDKFNQPLSSQNLILTDEIKEQVRELIKIQNPGVTFSTNEPESMTKLHIGAMDLSTYGVRIYYPWSHRLGKPCKRKRLSHFKKQPQQYKVTDEEGAAGAVCIISVKYASHSDYINAGRALQRVWPCPTNKGIGARPVSACVFMYARLLKGKGEV